MKMITKIIRIDISPRILREKADQLEKLANEAKPGDDVPRIFFRGSSELEIWLRLDWDEWHRRRG